MTVVLRVGCIFTKSCDGCVRWIVLNVDSAMSNQFRKKLGLWVVDLLLDFTKHSEDVLPYKHASFICKLDHQPGQKVIMELNES